MMCDMQARSTLLSSSEVNLLYYFYGATPEDLIAVLRCKDDELFFLFVKQCVSVTRKVARNGSHYWILREANYTRRPCMIIFDNRIPEIAAFWQTNGSAWHFFLDSIPKDATFEFHFQIVLEGFHKGGFDDGLLLEGFLNPPPGHNEYIPWHED